MVNVIINVSVPVSPPVSKDRASIVWGPTSVTEPLMLAMVEPRAFIVAPVTVAEIPSMYHSSAASRVASLSLSSVTVALKTKVGVPAVVPAVGPVTFTIGAVFAAGVLTSTEAVPVAPPLSVTVRVIRNSSDAERDESTAVYPSCGLEYIPQVERTYEHPIHVGGWDSAVLGVQTKTAEGDAIAG